MKIAHRHLVMALSIATLSTAVLAAPFAYVPNEKSGTLSVIDTETDTVVADIKAGDKPRGLAVSKDGKIVYVSDQPHNALVLVDVDKREATVIPFGLVRNTVTRHAGHVLNDSLSAAKNSVDQC